jgi:hypothetical protein
VLSLPPAACRLPHPAEGTVEGGGDDRVAGSEERLNVTTDRGRRNVEPAGDAGQRTALQSFLFDEKGDAEATLRDRARSRRNRRVRRRWQGRHRRRGGHRRSWTARPFPVRGVDDFWNATEFVTPWEDGRVRRSMHGVVSSR